MTTGFNGFAAALAGFSLSLIYAFYQHIRVKKYKVEPRRIKFICHSGNKSANLVVVLNGTGKTGTTAEN